MTSRTTLAAGHFFWPVMRDEGGCRRGSVCLCVRVSVCLGRRKCRHCLLTFRLRGPLTATADFFSLCRSYCNCLRAHNGALSVLRQMLLVCLVNMGAKERTSPSVPCAALTTTTVQIIIRERAVVTQRPFLRVTSMLLGHTVTTSWTKYSFTAVCITSCCPLFTKCGVATLSRPLVMSQRVGAGSSLRSSWVFVSSYSKHVEGPKSFIVSRKL